MTRKRWVLALSFSVSGALLWLVLRQFDVHQLSALFTGADVAPLLAAVLVALAVNGPLSAWALQPALAAHGVSLPYRAALEATLGHLALHAGATAVVGKSARAAYLARRYGADTPSALRAELSLLGLKLVALWALASVGALLSGHGWGAGSGALALALVAFWVHRRGAAVIQAFSLTLLMGLGQLGVFALALSALGASPPVASLLFWFPVGLLGAKLPVSVMGLGLRESLVVLLLRGSASPVALLGASLSFSAIEQILPGLVGLLFAPRFVEKTLT